MGSIVRLDATPLSVDPALVFRALGYPDVGAASAPVRALVPETIAQAGRRARPLGIFEMARVVKEGPATVRIEGGPLFHGGFLTRALAPASAAALFALTLGPDVSEWISEVTAASAVRGAIADVICSELVEAAADRFEKVFVGAAPERGMRATIRYSPGYCDWPIEELPSLLEVVRAKRIGIALTDGGMMRPLKSLAGIAGLTTDPRVARFVPCDVCKKTCPHRRPPS